MLADLPRVGRLVALATLIFAVVGCSGGEQPVRIGLLTDCRGLFSGYEDEALAGAELPLLQRGAQLANGEPTGGVSKAQVAGHQVEIVRGCTEESEHTVLVDEVRRLVENEHVDAVVGVIGEADSIVLREVARKYPDVVFVPTWTGAQELTLRHPAANVFRFDTDEAQDVAGLGNYAFSDLGWRRAAVVTDGTPVGWQEEAAFVAEFCANGGDVSDRLIAPTDLSDAKVAHALEHVDGVAWLTFGGLFVSPKLLPELAHELGSPATRIVVGAYVFENTNTLVPVASLPTCVVGAWSIPPSDATPAMSAYEEEFAQAFPGLPSSSAETPVALAFHDAMEGLLRGLEAADGDLSNGRRRLREELANLRFDLPSSPVRLDENHQAVRNTYLERVTSEGGKRVLRIVRVMPNVEQTFGGLLSNAPAPGPGSQPCRRGTPPPWAS